MRIPISGLLLALVSLPVGAQSPPDWTGRIEWARFGSALAAYVEYPSTTNADAVRALLPREHVPYTGSPEEEAALKTLDDGLDMLQRQVEAHDSASVRLAFDMWVVTDGAYWERLDIMLGELIRIDPQLFLSALRAHELRAGAPFVTDGLVGNLGYEFVDKSRASCREMRLRVEALESVRDGTLEGVKHEAIAELQRQIGEAHCPAA